MAAAPFGNRTGPGPSNAKAAARCTKKCGSRITLPGPFNGQASKHLRRFAGQEGNSSSRLPRSRCNASFAILPKANSRANSSLCQVSVRPMRFSRTGLQLFLASSYTCPCNKADPSSSCCMAPRATLPPGVPFACTVGATQAASSPLPSVLLPHFTRDRLEYTRLSVGRAQQLNSTTSPQTLCGTVVEVCDA